MTTDEPHDPTRAALRTGELESLSDAQLAELEQRLATDPALAAELADTRPAELSPAELPTGAEWADVWAGIERGERANPRPLPRVVRLFPLMSAVAACIGLFFLLRTTPNGANGSGWEFELAQDVVVHEVEVFGDDSAFVSYAPDDDGPAIIWVFEYEESGA